jgi:hypothetical protein
VIKVREARVDDLVWMLEQAKQFYAYHPLSIHYDANHVSKILIDMLENGVCLVAEQDGINLGSIGGVITPNFFDTSYLTLTEMYLWVEKAHRKSRAMHHLINAFTTAGDDVDCVILCHTKLTPSLGRVYEKKGYALMETAYTKEK